jgi:acetyl-CoA/propionyl-CoA carboxylase biotin carboxyl carrier protein
VRRLFVANRGEIARRIATSAERLGIEPVIPRLDGPDGVDLLDAAAVVAAARSASADAVHPGYGFLAESPLLAAAVLDAGLTWVGPSPEAIRSLGDKAAARALARSVDVPVAAGEEPADQSDASLAAGADRIGYPVLVKPVAGGGGKGIRVAATEAELAPALASARREAGRAFGDERLLLERFIPDARHVEVQLLGDAFGSVVHLGDRDCSLQRRHQKLLEEAPAPHLAADMRGSLWAAAVRLGQAAGYTNAGTCEFLVGADGSFVFLELNARLQVEHPVTELVLGRDLVADQLRLAEGATLAELGLGQAAIEDALARGGHAIEVRLNAEDPAHGFLPTTGRVVAARWPNGATAFGPVGEAGIRVDAGIAEGDEVGGAYDPLLAKVIAVGADRDEALARLGSALDATEVLGLTTNLAFLRRLVRAPVVVEGRIRTETVATDADVAAAARGPAEQAPPDAAWRAAAAALIGTAEPAGAWSGGWRANGPARLRLAATWGDEVVERAVEVEAGAPASASPALVLDGSVAYVSVDGASTAFRIAPAPDLAAAAERGASAHGAALPDVVRAPMPGRVVSVHVRPGDDLQGGDPVATVEAMKMEHVVASPGPARVEEVLVREGEQVERGRVVARLAPPNSEAAPA